MYQAIEGSRQSVTKYFDVEKANAAINNQIVGRRPQVIDKLYEVQLMNSEIQYTEPLTVGFFTLQHAKLKMLKMQASVVNELSQSLLRIISHSCFFSPPIQSHKS